MSVCTGNSNTPVIITKMGTHGRIRLPKNTPVKNDSRDVYKRQRMSRTIRERMNVRDNEVFTPIDLINAKTISSVINSFFGTNALSQFMAVSYTHLDVYKRQPSLRTR